MTDKTGLITALFVYTSLAALFGIALTRFCQIAKERRRRSGPGDYEPVAQEPGDCVVPFRGEYAELYEMVIAEMNKHVAALLEGHQEKLDNTGESK